MSRSSSSPAPRLPFPRVFVSPASRRRRDGCGSGDLGEPLPGYNEKEPGGEVAGAGDVSQLPRKRGYRDAPLRGPREGGEWEARTRSTGGTFSSASPSSSQTCRVPRGGAGGAPEVPGLTRTAPSRGTPSLPPALAHAGKPTDWASKGPYSCLITFRVAPCLFLLCQKGREFQN